MLQKFQDINQEVSPLFDELFVSYQKNYHHDKKFSLISFSFKDNSNLIICPLTIHAFNSFNELSFYGNPFEIISKNKLSKSNIISILNKIKEIEKKNNVKKISFKYEIKENEVDHYTDKNLYSVDEIYVESKIDLDNTIDDIKKDFSKGHKSSLKIVYPEISYAIIDHNNYKNKQISEMQELHFNVSKNKTRSDGTWLEMEKMVLEKKGFMIKVKNNNVLIGYSFFFHNMYSVYYFSSCILRDNFKSYKNIGHTMILEGIKYSKKNNLKYFILGRSKTLFESENKSDIKVFNVEKFKSSFGGIKKYYVVFNRVPLNLNV